MRARQALGGPSTLCDLFGLSVVSPRTVRPKL